MVHQPLKQVDYLATKLHYISQIFISLDKSLVIFPCFYSFSPPAVVCLDLWDGWVTYPTKYDLNIF